MFDYSKLNIYLNKWRGWNKCAGGWGRGMMYNYLVLQSSLQKEMSGSVVDNPETYVLLELSQDIEI